MPIDKLSQLLGHEIVCEDPHALYEPSSEIEITLEPCEEHHEMVVSEEPSDEKEEMVHLEVHDDDGEPSDDLEIVVDQLPGAPDGTQDPDVDLEVSEEDVNSAKDKKKGKWDWSLDGFFDWVKERLDTVPKHSGYSVLGLERAVEYMEKLDSEISKAMKSDFDGALDSDKVEELRAQIEDGIERLQARLEKVKKSPKNRAKKASDENSDLVKEGQKAPGVRGVMVTVPLLISSLARICVNGTVSAGHSMEEMYEKLCKKYKLSDREKLELVQLLSDMNYPLKVDRGIFPDDLDPTSSDNMDLSATYYS
jgi:ElaB/YqjD/DUF883 family membrane-anchored ribosome-binding protein